MFLRLLDILRYIFYSHFYNIQSVVGTSHGYHAFKPIINSQRHNIYLVNNKTNLGYNSVISTRDKRYDLK